MWSDLVASSRATAATVEPPSRITVWPSCTRPAVSLAMRVFSSLRRVASVLYSKARAGACWSGMAPP